MPARKAHWDPELERWILHQVPWSDTEARYSGKSPVVVRYGDADADAGTGPQARLGEVECSGTFSFVPDSMQRVPVHDEEAGVEARTWCCVM